MVLDVACGSESVTVGASLLLLEYPQGTSAMPNATFSFSPKNLSMSVDKQSCPIVRFDAFQDAGCTLPWMDLASLNLLNQTTPEQAYLNVTTWERLRYNLLR